MSAAAQIEPQAPPLVSRPAVESGSIAVEAPAISETSNHGVNALRISALLALTYGAADLRYRGPLLIAAALPLLVPRFVRHTLPWLAIALVLGIAIVNRWSSIENHKFMLFYWSLACAAAAASTQTERVLRLNARRLLTICFGAAAAWKWLGGAYLDGAFWRFTIASSRDLKNLATALGISAADSKHNVELFSALALDPSQVLAVHETSKLHAIALGLSWSILVCESVLSVAFLLSRWRVAARIGDFTLLSFIATSYAIVPLTAFGAILGCLGYAQAESRGLRRAYLAVMAWMMLMQTLRLHSVGDDALQELLRVGAVN